MGYFTVKRWTPKDQQHLTADLHGGLTDPAEIAAAKVRYTKQAGARHRLLDHAIDRSRKPHTLHTSCCTLRRNAESLCSRPHFCPPPPAPSSSLCAFRASQRALRASNKVSTRFKTRGRMGGGARLSSARRASVSDNSYGVGAGAGAGQWGSAGGGGSSTGVSGATGAGPSPAPFPPPHSTAGPSPAPSPPPPSTSASPPATAISPAPPPPPAAAAGTVESQRPAPFSGAMVGGDDSSKVESKGGSDNPLCPSSSGGGGNGSGGDAVSSHPGSSSTSSGGGGGAGSSNPGGDADSDAGVGVGVGAKRPASAMDPSPGDDDDGGAAEPPLQLRRYVRVCALCFFDLFGCVSSKSVGCRKRCTQL